jgi:hypothetical protein
MIVFKYLHPDRIDVLKNGLIRFTQPAALNDPFELRPNLSEVRRFFDGLHRNANGISPTASDVLGTQEAISETFGRWNEDNASDLVFLSLSKNQNNLLMWSHYCDSHRGFVIGFDANHPFFTHAVNGSRSALQKVNYSRYRPVVPAPDQNPEQFFKENTSLLTKSHHWKYEEELRMCASPKAANRVQPGPNGHPIYLFTFPKESVAEVILGYRMATDIRKTITAVVREKYQRAVLYQTALNEAEYDLDVNPNSD